MEFYEDSGNLKKNYVFKICYIEQKIKYAMHILYRNFDEKMKMLCK